MKNKSKTIFCDLDGTLVKHSNPVEIQNPDLELEVLPGTHDKLREWDSMGYHIIITTGRKESSREATIKQMQRAGINYDQLIMGFGGAVRYLINDRKPNNELDTAHSINLDRNKGIKSVKI
jgi:hydroxymethylpyrimidine pyrophosphatase-like HAD family hydrolase